MASPRDESRTDTAAFLGAAATGTLVPASAQGVNAALASEVGQAEAATIASAVEALIATLLAALPTGSEAWLESVRPDLPAGVRDEELARAIDDERDRQGTFLERMRGRLTRDVPGALDAPDPATALDTVLARERRYLRAHEEASATRIQGAAERDVLRRLSPEGAYWVLSPLAKEHTPGCLLLSAIGFLPWALIDALDGPPLHAGCRCRLRSVDEARQMGLLGDQLPDTTTAVAHRVDDILGWIHQIEEARVEDGEATLELEEVYWNRRFKAGTIWGGRFMPRRGGFAPRISLGDILRQIYGSDAPRIVPRGGQRPALAVSSGARSPGAPQAPAAPQAPRAPQIDRLGNNVRGLAETLAEEHGAELRLGTITVGEEIPDTGGFRDWSGNVRIGAEGEAMLSAREQLRASQQRLPDDVSGGVYKAKRTMVHEAMHGVNPISPGAYNDPAGFALDEALTEEAAHIKTVEMLKAEGDFDTLRWLARHPNDSRAVGVYQVQRAGLAKLLDDMHIPLEERADLIEHLAFSADADNRPRLLGEMLAERRPDLDLTPEAAENFVRATMAKSVDLDPEGLALGAPVLRPPNHVDRRMRVTPNALVKITGRDEEIVGRVNDAGYGDDGRWYAEVEVKLEDGSTTYRYPDPDDVEVVKDRPAAALKGENVTGPVKEGDRIRVRQLNGDILVGELSEVEGEDALGWRAEMTTEDGRTVILRPTSVRDVTRARATSTSRSFEGEREEKATEQILVGKEAQRKAAINTTAAAAHERWRENFADEHGDEAKRMKPTTDKEWSEAHDGATEVDLAHTEYADLPSDWQEENRLGAESAVVAILGQREREGTFDLETAASAVHDDWIARHRKEKWAKEAGLLKPYADLPESEKEKDRVFVRDAVEALGLQMPEPVDGPLAEVEGPKAFDARRYADPRRSLIRKARALKPGDVLKMPDGTEVERGKASDSVLVRRPDGTQRRYATVNRMSNAEIRGVMRRHNVVSTGKPAQPTNPKALAGQASPGAPSPEASTAFAAGRETFAQDQADGLGRINYIPDQTDLSQPQQSAVQAFGDPGTFDDLQQLLRRPDLAAAYLQAKYRESDGGVMFHTEGDEWVFGPDDVPEVMRERVRQALWLDSAIDEHGEEVGDREFFRVSGMGHLPEAERGRLEAGEAIEIEERGFLAAAEDLDVARAVGDVTAEGDQAIWTVRAAPGVKVLDSSGGMSNAEGEKIFRPGSKLSVRRVGDIDGTPHFEVLVKDSSGITPDFEGAAPDAPSADEMAALADYAAGPVFVPPKPGVFDRLMDKGWLAQGPAGPEVTDEGRQYLGQASPGSEVSPLPEMEHDAVALAALSLGGEPSAAFDTKLARENERGDWPSPDAPGLGMGSHPLSARGTGIPLSEAEERELSKALGGQASPAVLRRITDTLGVDPYDVDLEKLREHSELHERGPKSRFRFGSPCAASRETDFAVHRLLPAMLKDRYPDMAKRLARTSPRWGRLAHHERDNGYVPLGEPLNRPGQASPGYGRYAYGGSGRSGQVRLDAPITEILDQANRYTAEQGLPQAGVGQHSPSQASPPLFGQGSLLGKFKDKGKKAKPTPEVKLSFLEAPPAPVQGVPDYGDLKLTDVKAAGGSNGARIMSDKEGRAWLSKTYRGNRDRVATELLANAVYRELGVRVANAGVYTYNDPKHGPTEALTYPLIDGEIRRWRGENEDLGEGFVADALLANWDVVGLGQDNVLWNGNTPIRLDQGGTFEFRAMGKSKDFGPVPTELWTMSRGAGQANGRFKITEDGMRAQAADVEQRLTPERIDDLVDAAPFADEEMRERVRENLKARVEWLGRFSRGEEGLPEPLEGEAVSQHFAERDAKLETFPEEDDALQHYLEARAEVDTHLRSGKPKEAAPEEVQATVAALDGLLSADETRTFEEMYGWIDASGSLDPDSALKLETGKWLQERGYMNVDTDRPTGAVLVRVLIPEGKNAVSPDALGFEGETTGRVILRRGSKIRINSVEQMNGAAVIEATLA